MFRVQEEQDDRKKLQEPSYVGALNDTSTQHKSKGFQLAGQEENLECRLKEILILEQSLAGMFTRLVMKEKLNSAQLQPASEITNERRCVSYVRRYRKVRSSSIVKGKVVQSLQRLIETESKISLQVGDC
ncbi:hypothetical protein Tco_1447820 [Tanacetum coccineum]